MLCIMFPFPAAWWWWGLQGELNTCKVGDQHQLFNAAGALDIFISGTVALVSWTVILISWSVVLISLSVALDSWNCSSN